MFGAFVCISYIFYVVLSLKYTKRIEKMYMQRSVPSISLALGPETSYGSHMSVAFVPMTVPTEIARSVAV